MNAKFMSKLAVSFVALAGIAGQASAIVPVTCGAHTDFLKIGGWCYARAGTLSVNRGVVHSWDHVLVTSGNNAGYLTIQPEPNGSASYHIPFNKWNRFYLPSGTVTTIHIN